MRHLNLSGIVTAHREDRDYSVMVPVCRHHNCCVLIELFSSKVTVAAVQQQQSTVGRQKSPGRCLLAVLLQCVEDCTRLCADAVC